MKYVVDFQGFQMPEFVVKELAVLKMDSPTEVVTTLFQSPCSWDDLTPKQKKTNSWLSKHFHGIAWDAGDVSYEELDRELNNQLQDASFIFVKGLEKKTWLRHHLRSYPTIIDLLELKCPSLDELHASACRLNNYHRHVKNHHCATENARRLRLWLLEKFGDGASMKRSFTLLSYTDYLHHLDSEDIAALPREYLLYFKSRCISEIWNKLSLKIQNDEEFAACLPCEKHWNSFPGGDVIDGPPPMIKDCSRCKQ